MTIDDIRAQYPHPIAGMKAQYPYSDEEYCVGGALCLSLGTRDRDKRFPMSRELASAINCYNHTLGFEEAHEFAQAIIDYNDAERFEEAWQLLAQVLPVTTSV